VIDARLLRTLDLSALPGDKGVVHLSAASGLVRSGQRAFVVADDELSLGVFDLAADQPGRLHRLFDGDLPSHHDERKAAKPDLEALALLPAFAGFPSGALLAIGSGSKPNRQRGALLALDAGGHLAGAVQAVDLAPLYQSLRAQFTELNIEGLFVTAGDVCLLQRGNRQSQTNACIRFDWHQVACWLEGTGPAPIASSITAFALGALDGVPLGFTDGTALPGGGWAFCAAAEDSSDSYADGHCTGSAIGIVNAGGDLVQLERLVHACKAEGITGASDDDPLQLLLVTDADDRRAPAQLLAVTLPASAR